MDLKRSKSNSYIGGVCGGIAESTDTSALAWRVIFILSPYSLWAYLILWAVLKEREDEMV